jgi:hypothetical protein
MLVYCLAYSLCLKMEATYPSETSVDFQRTTRHCRYNSSYYRDLVTRQGVWIGNWTYWTLVTLNYITDLHTVHITTSNIKGSMPSLIFAWQLLSDVESRVLLYSCPVWMAARSQLRNSPLLFMASLAITDWLSWLSTALTRSIGRLNCCCFRQHNHSWFQSLHGPHGEHRVA